MVGRARASSFRTALAFVLGLLALLALVAYAGPRRVLDAVREASPAWLLLAALAYATFFVLRGWRWRSLLSRSAPGVRLSSTTSVTAVGWLANSFIPLKGGDVLRSALLAKKESVAAGTAAATVAIERVLDMVGLALVAALGLFLLPDDGLPAWFGRALEVAWLMPLLGIAALLLLVAFRRHALALSARATTKLGGFGAKLHEFVETTLAGIEALVRHPRLMALVIPQSFLVTLAQTLVFACLVRAFLPGTPFVVAFGGSAVFLLSFVVSVTPGNVGTYEAAFAAVFSALHAAPLDGALAAGILTHVTTTLLVGLLGGAGLIAVGARGKDVPTARRPAPTAPAGGGRA
jgi:uncharacterized protein (TIRG00374 family)